LLVHRDVSPSNVLIDWAGAVRLADFGLATSAIKATSTIPGVVFGKVGYMSPEQARREPLDGRADVYACGVVLWELLTGRPLRSHDQLDTEAVARFRAVAPGTLSRRVDAELDRIVLRALEHDREGRYPSAKAMLEDLGTWLARRAPDTAQETLATFMTELFGTEGERDRDTQDALLRELSRELGLAPPPPHDSDAGTRPVHTRVPTDPLAEERDTQAAQNPLPVQRPPTLEELEHIPAGSVIADRYRVLSRLGRGGMGTVYLGEHLTVGRSVAIKVLTHEWSRHEGVAARFRAEARAASAAGHPNIVEVFDAGELPDGRLYLVMEFLTGKNLYEEIRAAGPMEVARACRIVRSVARAVRAAHEVGIIHRDLKPDNVMLTRHAEDGEQDHVKVLDFGISAFAASEGAARLTVAGQALGTPEYMAPEQALGREATALFDIYALGVLLHEMLTGKPPFADGNAIEIMSRKAVSPAPSIHVLRGELPLRLCELVDDCLQIDPARRPASARVFLARVEEVLRALPREPDPGIVASEGRGESPLRAEIRREKARTGSALVWATFGVVAAAGAALLVWRLSAGGAASEGGEPAETARAGPSAPDPSDGARSGPPRPPGIAPASAGVAAAVDPGGETAPAELPGDRPAPATAGSAPSPPGAGDESSGGPPGVGQPAAAPGPQSEACRRARDRAADAREHSEWELVLKATRRPACWPDLAEPTRLRVKAFSELGLWQDCIAAGRESQDAAVRKLVGLCRAKLGAG
jgi:serine/threonine-protein kinase